MDWFRLESNKEGTKWFGKCWYVHNLLKYEFDVAFDVRLDWDYTHGYRDRQRRRSNLPAFRYQ